MPPRPKSTSPPRSSDAIAHGKEGNSSHSKEESYITVTSCVSAVNDNTSLPTSSAILHPVQQNYPSIQKLYPLEQRFQVHREFNQSSQTVNSTNLRNMAEFPRGHIGSANPHFYPPMQQQNHQVCSTQGQVNMQGLAAGTVTLANQQPAQSQLLGRHVDPQQPQQQQIMSSPGSQEFINGIDKLTQQFSAMSAQTPFYVYVASRPFMTGNTKQEKAIPNKCQVSPDQLVLLQQPPPSWPHAPYCLASPTPGKYISNQPEPQYMGYMQPNSMNSEMTLVAPHPSANINSKGSGWVSTNAEIIASPQKLYSHNTAVYDPSVSNQLASSPMVGRTISQFPVDTYPPYTTNSNPLLTGYVNPQLTEVTESQFAMAVNPQLSTSGVASNGLENNIYCSVPNNSFNLQPSPPNINTSNMAYIPTSIAIAYGYPVPPTITRTVQEQSDTVFQPGITLMAPGVANAGYCPPSLVATDVRSNAGSSPEQENCRLNSEMGLLTKGGMDLGYVAMIPASPSSNPLMNSANMEMVWHRNFDYWFGKFAPHAWKLSPTTEGIQDPAYLQFNDSAKVRFLCENCCNAWTSMKGRVVFWFNLDHTRQHGQVFFKLFGQKCQKCMPEEFEHAMWYPEEVNKVLTNLHLGVGNAYYGWERLTGSIDRRPGKPRTQHNISLCQACATGICREGATLVPPALVAPSVCEYPIIQGMGHGNMFAQLQVVG